MPEYLTKLLFSYSCMQEIQAMSEDVFYAYFLVCCLYLGPESAAGWSGDFHGCKTLYQVSVRIDVQLRIMWHYGMTCSCLQALSKPWFTRERCAQV